MSGIQLPANQIWADVEFGENVKVRADQQARILDARLFSHWAVDHATSDEGTDTLGYRGGIAISSAGVVSVIADGTVALTDNATNYVERTIAGVVSANTSAFTAGRLPLYKVVVASHVFTAITDLRTSAGQSAVTSVLGQTGAVTFAVAIPFIIDGAGVAITTGIKGDLEVPFAGTITGWTLLADQSGSIVIDTWKDSYANYPPTIADTMWGTKPALSGAAKNQATGLSIAVAAGSIIRYNVDSAATLTRALLSFTMTRTS